MRAHTASEVLLLESLAIARQRAWVDFAGELVRTRAATHVALLTEFRNAAVVLPSLNTGAVNARDLPDNSAKDRRRLAERLDDAIASATFQQRRVEAALKPGQVANAHRPRRMAAVMLSSFAQHAATLPDKLRDTLDHHLALVHRRHMAGGTAELAHPPKGQQAPASELRKAPSKPGPHAISGLALSGGGVRSASFALGALQEFNQVLTLRSFDIMSAVSGGSWALGWLSAWAYRHRNGLEGVEMALRPATHDDIAPLRWVRRHITYMVTRPGLASGDSWALVAAYIANWLPIVTLAALMLLSLLVFPHALSASASDLAASPRNWVHDTLLLLVAAVIVAFLALLRRLTLYYREPGERERYAPGLRWLVPTLALLGAVGLAVTLPLLAAQASEPGAALYTQAAASGAQRPLLWGVVIGAWVVVTVVSVALAWFLAQPPGEALGDVVRRMLGSPTVQSGQLKRHEQPVLREILALLLTVALASALTLWLLPQALQLRGGTDWRIALGPLAVMAVVAVSELLGSMATHRADVHRAWAARLGGWMLGAVVGWTLLAGFALGVTRLFRDPSLRLAAAVVAGAFVLTAAALVWLMARGLRQRRHALTLACTMSSLALLLPMAAAWLTRDSQGELLSARTLWWTLAGCMAGLYVLASLCNVNRHSLHAVYKQGLVRSFLGASRLSVHNPDVEPRKPLAQTDPEAPQFQPRRPQPSTNIDDDDNPALAWLASKPGRSMPLLLINAAVNGVSLRDREGRAPRQWPFTFSQEFTGSPADGIGYAATREFHADDPSQRLSLGGAMAVSSAAMSPIAGGATHPLRAFVLGLLNARLGMWIGNPQHPKDVRRGKPNLGGLTVLREMLGLRSLFGKSIHLSDGGHFENLGIYELVRRGCTRIVAIDASCDPHYEFADLADAIRRARLDLHVKIHPRDDWRILPPSPTVATTARSWMWFDIDYGAGLPSGLMLYVKPAIYAHDQTQLRAEVLNYAREAPDFPHESTLNQQYSEKQMEAYRLLGEACMRHALREVTREPSADKPNPDYDAALMLMMLRRA